MSQEAVEFDYNRDSDNQSNIYPCYSIDNIKVPDSNSKNYSNGMIQFNSVKLGGTDPNTQYSLSKAKVDIPYTITLDAEGCTFTSDGTNVVLDNKYACSTKGFHNFIESSTHKMGSTSLNEKVDNQNIIMNENLKRMSYDEKLLYGTKLNYELDNANSYRYSAQFGEYNNVVRPSANSNGKVDDVNHGHLARMRATNNYYDTLSTDAISAFVSQEDITTSLYPCMIKNSGTQLVFTGFASIPLSEIHDCYKQMPSMSSINEFTMRLQTNLAQTNKWTIVYGNTVASSTPRTTGTAYDVKGIVANQSYGTTCPILVSNCGVASSTGAGSSSLYGLTVYPNAVDTIFKVNVSCKIGYCDKTGADTGQVCQLSIPSQLMNPVYTNKILEKGLFRMLYNEHATTWFLNRGGNSTITEKIQGLFQRPRKLYVIAFLSKSMGVTSIGAHNVTDKMVSPYQSPVSSAPVTCSPCKLYDVNIRIGNKAIYGEPLKFSHEFYDEHVLESLGKINGNSVNNPFFTGLIDKSMWERCYQAYVFNISRSMNELLDNEPKELYFSCKTLGLSGVKYDLLVVVEHQRQMTLNRATGNFAIDNDIQSN